MSSERGTLGQRVFARIYPRVMERAERGAHGALRARHLSRARGRTLDLGTGNGYSVPHYPAEVAELVMVEPNPVLRGQLQGVVGRIRAPRWEILDGDAYRLPFEDDSFDTVAASLVFCSLDDPDLALREVHRVLRAEGTFLFHEHVRGRGARGVVHDLISPVQRRLGDGCRPNRDFLDTVGRSPFDLVEVEELDMPGGSAWVPLVIGAASPAR
ncbi:class I SAM-dependent methyltransferase [Nocardioides sp. GY 10113]|uniref:class I SAM-dependent methyltransferase n=1 Tax=Nocardioides sp. GY 10113 TaxID=2569761 RepID=UPI0010A7F5CE|nr:class I SAM-dependent methyltransferase [Nocardioides sp. GY 10113]TIC85905.1 class I SAM-dependent methyltransferase [Nocardioides sp. GY 10113]